MSDLARFLERVGLGRYERAFAENDIDLETIPHLNETDLVEMGLSLGHRRKLAAALQDLALRGDLPDERTAEWPVRHLGERRQLTVVFCDLVGSTELAAALDPEDLRRVMQRYHDVVSKEISTAGGYVAKLLGDGILAYFGFPKADENDCERALRAAQAVIDSVRAIALEPDVGRQRLDVRIGIATGLVVIGEMKGGAVTDTDAVVGETPNLAARLQSLAAPGTIVISAEAHDLVGDIFEYEDLGQRDIPGFAEPLRAWRVLRDTRFNDRFHVLRGARMTDLIGRNPEVDHLRERWALVRAGKGSVVLISGEAGIGKSRLVQALRNDIAADATTRLQYQCSQFDIDKAFAPVIGHLEHAAGFAFDDSVEQRKEKLSAILLDDGYEVFAALLRLPGARAISDIEPDPELRRERILESLMDQIRLRSAKGPMLVIVEDLHWIDPSTEAFVNRLVDASRSLPMLVVLTGRPDIEPSWLDDPHVSVAGLKRLDAEGIRKLIFEVTGGRALPPDFLDQIERRTDGIPLFVEELTRSVLQSGMLKEDGKQLVAAARHMPQAIPMTLQESLTARLDRMSAVKHIAQVGAVIGRRFSFRLIASVSDVPYQALDDALSILEKEGLLSQRGAGAHASFEFRHALIREAAYESLLRSTRAELHERVARTLLTEMPETAAADPAIVAHHFTSAGLKDAAIDHWIAAGDLAVETSGFVEALSNYSMALDILRQAGDGPDRDGREIAVLLAMGPCQVQVLGPASDDVLATYSQAVALGDAHGTLEQRFKALWGLWFYHFMLGAVTRMRELAKELGALARELGDEALVLEGHHCEWASLSLLGELDGALDATGKGMELYRKDKHHWMTYHYGGHDPGLCALNLRAVNLCLKGYPDQAKVLADDAVDQALDLDHAYTLLEGLFCTLTVMMLRSDYAAIRTHAARLIGLAEAKRVPPEASALANGFIGWVEVRTGATDDGIARMRASIDDWQGFWGAWCFPLDAGYAEALADTGDLGTAWSIVDRAAELGGSSGGHWWDAEFLRIRGKICAMGADPDRDRSRRYLENAIAAAHNKKGKLFELRAANDLASMYLKNGEIDAARALLAEAVADIQMQTSFPDFERAMQLLEACAAKRPLT
ncbi:ATP-binding protein [Lutimaribacter marinistellae]|uniref:ATP-binding protein n=1 Tax=Lutimaribacter marinistellae TaxID=1820329 RepID=A0ABV7TM18_9RHOB